MHVPVLNGFLRPGPFILAMCINLLTLKRLNAHTCLMYAARIRGAVLQEHWVVSYL